MKAHWGIPDPAAVEGEETTRTDAFQNAFTALEDRIRKLVDLPLASLDEPELQRSLEEIGRG